MGVEAGAVGRREIRGEMGAVEEVSLRELRRGTSAKWRTYPPDVLPLPVAEMDFPLAGPVAEALHAPGRASGARAPATPG